MPHKSLVPFKGSPFNLARASSPRRSHGLNDWWCQGSTPQPNPKHQKWGSLTDAKHKPNSWAVGPEKKSAKRKLEQKLEQSLPSLLLKIGDQMRTGFRVSLPNYPREDALNKRQAMSSKSWSRISSRWLMPSGPLRRTTVQRRPGMMWPRFKAARNGFRNHPRYGAGRARPL